MFPERIPLVSSFASITIARRSLMRSNASKLTEFEMMTPFFSDNAHFRSSGFNAINFSSKCSKNNDV